MSRAPSSSKGPWTGVFFGATAKYCAGERGAVAVSEPDARILCSLAKGVRQLANRPREEEKRRLWYDHNALIEKYPVILCDPENGWNEIIPESSLECHGALSRRWEWVLRRQIFWGEQLLDDRPIEATFEIGLTHSNSEWGIEIEYRGGENATAYSWKPALKGQGDVEQIQTPVIDIDSETTEETLALAHSLFDDELTVMSRGLNPNNPHMTRDLAKMVGMQEMMMMMYDDPSMLHAIMRKFLDGYTILYDFLEAEGLLTLDNDASYVGSGGIGYTRELPRRKLGSGERVLTGDLWLHTESQESVGVSPEMFEEFIFPYQTVLHKRFGLNCYGCCEALEGRWHLVRQIPNLRRVSVSAWADEEKMAANLGDRYIYSRKPSPVDLAMSLLDESSARRSIRRTLEVTRDSCVVEFVMKDNHTLGGNPDNVIRWVKIAREEVARACGKP